MRVAPLTTWLLVTMSPSGVKTKPEPEPLNARAFGVAAAFFVTSMKTTDGLTRSAVPVTTREYASSRWSSLTGWAADAERSRSPSPRMGTSSGAGAQFRWRAIAHRWGRTRAVSRAGGWVDRAHPFAPSTG